MTAELYLYQVGNAGATFSWHYFRWVWWNLSVPLVLTPEPTIGGDSSGPKFSISGQWFLLLRSHSEPLPQLLVTTSFSCLLILINFYVSKTYLKCSQNDQIYIQYILHTWNIPQSMSTHFETIGGEMLQLQKQVHLEGICLVWNKVQVNEVAKSEPPPAEDESKAAHTAHAQYAVTPGYHTFHPGT